MLLGTSVWLWVSFIALVFALLALDLGVLNRRDHIISIKESLKLSAFYIVLALLFGLWVGYTKGSQAMSEYYTGYLVEKSLSVDNLFVIALVFSYFAIPLRLQHRVLFWGILGVIMLRGVMIGVGSVLVQKFAWLLFIFAAFLIIMGIKMLFKSDKPPDIAHNPVLRYFRKHFRITHDLQGHHFFVKSPHPRHGERQVWWMTPLFLALCLIEGADIIFALDSIPAIFAITTDTYVVYTSNIFAILGLRSLYFALQGLLDRFVYLNYALALILVFIGGKVFVTPLLGWEKFPAWISLSVTILLLAGGIGWSLIRSRKAEDR